MKKLLGLLLVAVIAFPANAAVIKNVELKGEVQTIASDVKANANFMSWLDNNWYNRGTTTRVLAGLSFDVVEDVKANLLFQYAYGWGDNNYLNNGFEDAKGMKLVNANLVFSNLFDMLEVTIGRQFYGEDGDPIIYFGPNHYNAEGGLASALDAVTVRYSDDTKALTLLAGKVADLSNGFLAAWWDDIEEVRANIWGADFKLNVADGLTANVYGYDVTGLDEYWKKEYYGPLADDANKHVGVYGAKLGWTTDTFRASAEYARNFAGHRLVKEHKDTPYMVKADIAADIEAFTARGTFLYAKSANEQYEDSFPFFSLGNYAPGLLIGHRLSANMEESIFNYSVDGVRMFNIGVDYKPADQWTVSLDAFSFQGRTGKHSATYEFDVTAKYDYNDYVQLFAGLGYAKYGNDVYNIVWDTYKNMFGSENYKGQIGMLVRF